MRTCFLLALLAFCPLLYGQVSGESAELQAWRNFTTELESAGADILSTYPQPTTLDRAEGLRYLLQQLAASAEQQLLTQPEQISLLRVGATTIDKWGMDGADAKYQGAALRGGGHYRLYGRLGGARLVALQIARIAGTYAAYEALTKEQLKADAQGNFELMISANRPEAWEGAWLELAPEADNLLIREYFGDWSNEQPGRYHLERLDAPKSGRVFTTDRATKLLDDTVKTFSTRAPQWRSRVEQTRTHRLNKVQMRKADGQGLASNHYGSSWFRIAPDEALVIELEAPQAVLWSVQLGNVWWESIDYINHSASFNNTQAVPSSDGKYRFVVALDDPEVPNWLDPVGHTEGALLFRMQKANTAVNPQLKVVLLSQLSQHLPDDTPQINEKARANEMAARRRHAAVRWAP